MHDILAWYADHDVELILGTRVSAIDRSAHTVTLDLELGPARASVGGTLALRQASADDPVPGCVS